MIQHYTEDGTAVHPTSFKIKYEFVDTRYGGDVWLGRRGEDPPPQPCSRIFRKNKSGIVKSPKNIFLYGRGGATNLSCVYRLEASTGEKIKLSIHNASFGDNDACVTESDPHTDRYICSRSTDPDIKITELTVSEVPWRDVRVFRGCFCDNSTLSTHKGSPVVFVSSSRVLEVSFYISKFNITQDFTDIYFHASYEIIRSPECPRKQRVRGSGGEIEMIMPPQVRADVYCEGLPWLVEAHENKSLFLLTWGHFLNLQQKQEDVSCVTKNRVLLYSGRPLKYVHCYSIAWSGLLTALS